MIPLTDLCATPNQARQRMRTFAGNSAFAQSILGGNAPEGTINADHNNARHKVSPGKNVGLQNAQRIDVGNDVESEKKCFGGSEDPVVRSPVMLEFGTEVPAHTASTCGRAVQLPVPDAWDEPEVREAAASQNSNLLLSVLRCHLEGRILACFSATIIYSLCAQSCLNISPTLGSRCRPSKLGPSFVLSPSMRTTCTCIPGTKCVLPRARFTI